MESLIWKPIISEKSLQLAGKGWYTFAVQIHVRKEDIARGIEAFYSVNVIDVRTVHMHGKSQRRGKKMVRKTRQDWKKAMVKLKSGQNIDAFTVMQKDDTKKNDVK